MGLDDANPALEDRQPLVAAPPEAWRRRLPAVPAHAASTSRPS